MKQRTISAAIMLAIIIPIIILGGWFYSLAIGLVCSFAYKELTEIRSNTKDDFPAPMKLIGLISTLMICYQTFDSNGIIFGLDYNILGATILFLMIPTVFYKNEKYSIEDAFYLLGNVLFLGISFNLFIGVRTFNIYYFVLLILITTLTDTFAYLGGMLIGKHTFTKISPKKTIEGCLIGSLVSTFICTVYYVNVINTSSNLLLTILSILILSIIGQIGDLFFSAIKRKYNKKDFSNLIPGHGGILDRLDSLIFVIIAFVVIIGLINF